MAAAAADQPSISKILVASDLGRAADAATGWGFDLARHYRADVLIVSVIDPRDVHLSGGRSSGRVDQVRERREAAAVDLVDRGRHLGVAVTFLVWTGDPGQSIVEAATAERPDLVLIGSRGRGGVTRLLLGSVSDHVVRHAPCPVLVVRETEHDDIRREDGA